MPTAGGTLLFSVVFPMLRGNWPPISIEQETFQSEVVAPSNHAASRWLDDVPLPAWAMICCLLILLSGWILKRCYRRGRGATVDAKTESKLSNDELSAVIVDSRPSENPSTKEEQPQRFTCRQYDGFIEHAYRLLFAFDERFNCKPELKTILPSGTIENEKILEPEEERALICFAYAQDISADAAPQFLETPFVWERENGTFGLVQTWPVRFNEKFKKDFAYVKYPQNPDEAHFAPQAMEEFKQTVFNMFGEHEDPPLYFCHKQTQNSKSVYTGRGSALLDMLRTNDVIRKELDIVDILEPDGFKSRWVNGKQEEGEKEFHMALDEEYALYTKQGWETMACVKLWHQFDSEVTIGQEVDFVAVAKDRTRCAAEAAF